MVVNNVTVRWGYRFLIKSDEQWVKIVKKYGGCENYKNEDDDDDDDHEFYIDKFDNKLNKWCKTVHKDCEHYYIICSHSENDMKRYIDIGFNVGKFNISGMVEEKENIISAEKMTACIKLIERNKKAFKEMPIWKYRVRNEPSLYGLPDDCLYCS